MRGNAVNLACDQLQVGVPGRNLVTGLELELRRGELLAVLGRNGVGKVIDVDITVKRASAPSAFSSAEPPTAPLRMAGQAARQARAPRPRCPWR